MEVADNLRAISCKYKENLGNIKEKMTKFAKRDREAWKLSRFAGFVTVDKLSL